MRNISEQREDATRWGPRAGLKPEGILFSPRRGRARGCRRVAAAICRGRRGRGATPPRPPTHTPTLIISCPSPRVLGFSLRTPNHPSPRRSLFLSHIPPTPARAQPPHIPLLRLRPPHGLAASPDAAGERLASRARSSVIPWWWCLVRSSLFLSLSLGFGAGWIEGEKRSVA
jgi:hypothetical protein